MCLILFAYRCHPDYPLVFIANRDEFLDRPTAPLGHNFPGENILGGRDLQGGGSWLVTDGGGRLGALTNFRDPARQLAAPPSRGEIVLDYLRSGLSPTRFLAEFSNRSSVFNPFNLLLGDAGELCYFSNVTLETKLLSPGYYGLSNHLLDSDWPKVRLGKKLLQESLVRTAEPKMGSLFAILANNQQPADEQLPETGVGLIWERLLAPLFIHSPSYGTRSSSVMLIDSYNTTRFTEKSYTHVPDGWSESGEVSHTVALRPEQS